MSEKDIPGAKRPDADRFLKPSKSALTRARILDAGHAFLETRPFRDLTVGGLMADTGQSRPTFYQYFNDLHGLIEALLDEVKGSIIEGAQPWLSNDEDPVAGLQESLTALVDVGFDRGAILKAVTDAAPSDARLESVWGAFVASFDEVVSAQIARHQQLGFTPDFDPMPVAQALNRMNAGLLIHAFGAAPKADKKDVLGAIMRVWLSTLYPFDAEAAILRGARRDS